MDKKDYEENIISFLVQYHLYLHEQGYSDDVTIQQAKDAAQEYCRRVYGALTLEQLKEILKSAL